MSHESGQTMLASSQIYVFIYRQNKSLRYTQAYLRFVTGTTGSAGVKMFSLLSKNLMCVCFGVKILNFVYFGVKNLELVCFWCQLKMVLVSTKRQISRLHTGTNVRIF